MRSRDPLPHKFETPNHAQFLDPYLIFQSTFLKIPPRSKGDNTDIISCILLCPPVHFLKFLKLTNYYIYINHSHPLGTLIGKWKFYTFILNLFNYQFNSSTPGILDGQKVTGQKVATSVEQKVTMRTFNQIGWKKVTKMTLSMTHLAVPVHYKIEKHNLKWPCLYSNYYVTILVLTIIGKPILR